MYVNGLASAEQRHVLQILVVNHLVMNHLAQRRDITDPKVIAEFASIVESVPYLEQLYLLTYADTSGCGTRGMDYLERHATG